MKEIKVVGAWWYALAVCISIGGCGASTLLGLGGVEERVASMKRAVMPGQTTFRLSPGEYTGFYEPRSIVAGEVYETSPSIDGLECSLHSDSGEAVELRQASTRTSYSFKRYVGVSIVEFEIEQKDIYALHCKFSNGSTKPAVLALGTSLGGSIAKVVIIALLFTFIGLALFGWAYVHRRKARKLGLL